MPTQTLLQDPYSTGHCRHQTGLHVKQACLLTPLRPSQGGQQDRPRDPGHGAQDLRMDTNIDSLQMESLSFLMGSQT